MFSRVERIEKTETKQGAKVTTITEYNMYFCDKCGQENRFINKCVICGKDFCSNCSTNKYCKNCWESNSIAGKVVQFKNIREVSCGYGYHDQEFMDNRLEFDDKHSEILKRFSGKKVKITFEALD